METKFPGLPVNLKDLILAAKQGLRGEGDAKRGTLAIFLPRNSRRKQIEAAIPWGATHDIKEDSVDGRLKGLTVFVGFNTHRAHQHHQRA